MILRSKRRVRGPWGRTGPVVSGLSVISRAVAVAWRRSLQLRVVVLTLGMSLAVLLVLGFVLTSQITDRVLEVKVRAATEEMDRARTTVGGIVGGALTPIGAQKMAELGQGGMVGLLLSLAGLATLIGVWLAKPAAAEG